MLARRIRGEPFPATKFSLGVFGYLINILALCFLLVAFVFVFFPAVPDPDVAEMNWTTLIYGSAVVFAFGYYVVKGRKEYEGPVVAVKWQMPVDVIG